VPVSPLTTWAKMGVLANPPGARLNADLYTSFFAGLNGHKRLSFVSLDDFWLTSPLFEVHGG